MSIGGPTRAEVTQPAPEVSIRTGHHSQGSRGTGPCPVEVGPWGRGRRQHQGGSAQPSPGGGLSQRPRRQGKGGHLSPALCVRVAGNASPPHMPCCPLPASLSSRLSRKALSRPLLGPVLEAPLSSPSPQPPPSPGDSQVRPGLQAMAPTPRPPPPAPPAADQPARSPLSLPRSLGPQPLFALGSPPGCRSPDISASLTLLFLLFHPPWLRGSPSRPSSSFESVCPCSPGALRRRLHLRMGSPCICGKR